MNIVWRVLIDSKIKQNQFVTLLQSQTNLLEQQNIYISTFKEINHNITITHR